MRAVMPQAPTSGNASATPRARSRAALLCGRTACIGWSGLSDSDRYSIAFPLQPILYLRLLIEFRRDRSACFAHGHDRRTLHGILRVANQLGLAVAGDRPLQHGPAARFVDRDLVLHPDLDELVAFADGHVE